MHNQIAFDLLKYAVVREIYFNLSVSIYIEISLKILCTHMTDESVNYPFMK